jgi:hypothetical protein
VLEQIVDLTDHFAGERLFGMSAGDSERSAGYSYAHAECGFYRAHVRVVLTEQIGKQARIVEMEFERVFGG